MYAVDVLADSIAEHGVRVTTMEITFPRFILAEFNTHRMLSRNSASSRAIPTEKLLSDVINHPFRPVFNQRVKGMGVGDKLTGQTQRDARYVWEKARLDAIGSAQELLKIGVDKSRANRLLEPFMWHTVIVTATEWTNFFALRNHEAAQPEIRNIASMMELAYFDSTPILREYGRWGHLPFVTDEERQTYAGSRCALLSASRCARVSYDRQHEKEPIERTLERAAALIESSHLSPFEHPAYPVAPSFVGDEPTYIGNFKGWFQYRKTLPNEHDFWITSREQST